MAVTSYHHHLKITTSLLNHMEVGRSSPMSDVCKMHLGLVILVGRTDFTTNSKVYIGRQSDDSVKFGNLITLIM